MSSSRLESNSSYTIAVAVASVLTTAVTTAYMTYVLTKQNEEAKQRAIVARQYEREKLLKEKTALARKNAVNGPESGAHQRGLFMGM